MEILNQPPHQQPQLGLVASARPRRCAERIIVNLDIASGLQLSNGSFGKSSSSADSGRVPMESALTAPPPLTVVRRSAPRCLKKLGPKPTDLILPSSFEAQRVLSPPPPPPRSREERDAKHKLILLLWESFRFQKKMFSLQSSSASLASSSGGSTPVSKWCSPPHCQAETSSLPSHSPNTNNTTSSHTNHGRVAAIPSPSSSPNSSISSSSSSSSGQLAMFGGAPSLLLPRPQTAAATPLSEAEEACPPLLIPKPSTLPQEGVGRAAERPSSAGPSDSGAYLLRPPPRAPMPAVTAANTAVYSKVTGHSSAAVPSPQLPSPPPSTLAAQWRAMVAQLDEVWDHLEGDVEAKYYKLKVRITSMLLWERLDCERSMLSPPLHVVRRMSDDHERRLRGLPHGQLFYATSSSVPSSPTSLDAVATLLPSSTVLLHGTSSDDSGNGSDTSNFSNDLRSWGVSSLLRPGGSSIVAEEDNAVDEPRRPTAVVNVVSGKAACDAATAGAPRRIVSHQAEMET